MLWRIRDPSVRCLGKESKGAHLTSGVDCSVQIKSRYAILFLARNILSWEREDPGKISLLNHYNIGEIIASSTDKIITVQDNFQFY